MLHAARNTKTHSTHATKTCADGERTLRTRTHRYARYTNKNPQHVLGARTAPITTENEKSKSCYAMCVYAYHMYSQIEYRRKRRRKRGRRKRLKFSNVLHNHQHLSSLLFGVLHVQHRRGSSHVRQRCNVAPNASCFQFGCSPRHLVLPVHDLCNADFPRPHLNVCVCEIQFRQVIQKLEHGWSLWNASHHQ